MAYNLLDLITAVQDDLNDPSFSTTRLTRYLNYAQTAIFNTHMFKFCEREASGNLGIGSNVYALESDHQATLSGVVVDQTAGRVVLTLDDDTYVTPDEFFEAYPDVSLNPNAPPSSWTEYGSQILFDRPADKAYTFKHRYLRSPTTLAANADVPDVPVVFRELLELYALHRAEKKRGNHDVAATYLQEYEDGLESMVLRYGPRTKVGPARMRSARTRVNSDD